MELQAHLRSGHDSQQTNLPVALLITKAHVGRKANHGSLSLLKNALEDQPSQICWQVGRSPSSSTLDGLGLVAVLGFLVVVLLVGDFLHSHQTSIGMIEVHVFFGAYVGQASFVFKTTHNVN